jgi:hypothetical protein
MSTRYTDYDFAMALLGVFASSPRHQHIMNVLGAPGRPSTLEHHLGAGEFTLEERGLAMRSAREMQDLGLIVPTYEDLAAPEEWRQITTAGKDALARGALDDLDRALADLSPDFVTMRRGAWRSALSTSDDTARHAAHSGRELITQVLHVLSPDGEVRGQTWFQQDPKHPDRVPRKARYRNAIQKRARGWSESDLDVAQKASDLLEAQYQKLSATAHARGEADRQSVVDALNTAEIVLRILLV